MAEQKTISETVAYLERCYKPFLELANALNKFQDDMAGKMRAEGVIKHLTMANPLWAELMEASKKANRVLSS